MYKLTDKIEQFTPLWLIARMEDCYITMSYHQQQRAKGQIGIIVDNDYHALKYQKLNKSLRWIRNRLQKQLGCKDDL